MHARPPRTLRRRILQPLMVGLVLLMTVSIVAATLTNRPAIELPTRRAVDAQQSRDADFLQTLSAVDQQLAELAHQAGLEVAPAADNLTVARRLSLALVGSGLSLEEIRALEMLPEAQQLPVWTEHLLADSRWSDYFAERFARAFVGTSNGPFLLFRKRKLNAWLADQFLRGVPYDQTVSGMLTAEGLWTDTPQVNFITATMDDANRGRGDPIRLAGRTSRVFLAQRIDCVQCHDDFLGTLEFGSAEQPCSGTQEHFHQLAAFYSGTALANPVFRGIKEDGQVYRYQFLGEESAREVAPAVPFLPELIPEEGKPRQRLAAWVTHPDNRAFARATVNRVWALLFARPLVEPVDSIPLHDPVPAPLDTLAADFVRHQFDLRRLIRLITSTQAFARDSRATFIVNEAHEKCWAVFPLTQLRPEQVAGSLFQSSKLATIDSSSSILTRLIVYGQTQDFLKRFGDRGEDEFESDAVTIAQRLLMMNGKFVAERTKVDLINNAATRIAVLVADDVRAIELLSLSVLNRRSTLAEQAHFAAHLAGKSGRARQRGLGDIAWAMINSTEFSWNH